MKDDEKARSVSGRSCNAGGDVDIRLVQRLQGPLQGLDGGWRGCFSAEQRQRWRLERGRASGGHPGRVVFWKRKTRLLL